MQFHEFAELFPDARGPRSGGWYSARCPAHDDRQASLGFKDGDDGVVFTCHAQCDKDSILEAVGLTMADTFYPDSTRDNVRPIGKGRLGALIDRTPFVNAEGGFLYEERRYADEGSATGKNFRIWPKMPPVADRVLYNLPGIVEAKATGAAIYIVEGAKDAKNMEARGYLATTNALGGGTNKWLEAYTRQMAGARTVIVIGDRDDTGIGHVQEVHAALAPVVDTITCYLPPEGYKDVSDLFEAGLGLDVLEWFDPTVKVDASEALGLGLLTAASVTSKPIPWAWRYYMPRGSVVNFDGDPGGGKSTMITDLTARFSRGAPMPDGSPNGFGGPVDVIVFSIEDDPEYTVVPRLRAAGADLARVHIVTSARPDITEMFDIGLHIARLRHSVAATGAQVITIDPLAAYLGDVKTGDDASVRRHLQPLFDLCRETEALAITARHMNKNRGAKAADRSSGSVAFLGISRASFVVGRDPEDPDVRVMARLKTNLVRDELVPSLAYRLVSTDLGGDIDVARVQWQGVVEVDAQRAIDGAAPEEQDAKEAFLAAVAEGPRKWAEIAKYVKTEYGLSFGDAKLRALGKTYLDMHTQPGLGMAGAVWVAKGTVWPPDGGTSQSPGGTSQALLKDEKASDQSLHALPPLLAASREGPEQDPGVSPVDPEAALLAAPKVCDQCGETGVPFLKPWWVMRCAAHNPMTWRP